MQAFEQCLVVPCGRTPQNVLHKARGEFEAERTLGSHCPAAMHRTPRRHEHQLADFRRNPAIGILIDRPRLARARRQAEMQIVGIGLPRVCMRVVPAVVPHFDSADVQVERSFDLETV